MAIFIPMFTTNAFGYTYEKKLIDSHVIHILYVNSDEYEAEIVKANNGNIGRETVSSMAKKSSADIAINAGFFEIGGNIDGVPSGTLIIKGKEYNLQKAIQPLVIIKNGIISIDQSKPENYKHHNISLVSGIPMLINNGKISDELFDKKSGFYTQPHARTAVGVASGSKVIIVVVEHYYAKDINAITVGELQSLIKTKGKTFAGKYKKQDPEDLTLNELKQILRDEFSPHDVGTQGLTILNLAKLMQDLGCQYAINLDGGGSSTLWIKGKIINNTFGDKDEAVGEKIERPVSDAIIFRKR